MNPQPSRPELPSSPISALTSLSHDRWLIERFGALVWELRDGRLIQHHDDPDRVVAGLLARHGTSHRHGGEGVSGDSGTIE